MFEGKEHIRYEATMVYPPEQNEIAKGLNETPLDSYQIITKLGLSTVRYILGTVE